MSATNLEAAVAINGTDYSDYVSLFVDAKGEMSLFGLTGVNTLTKGSVQLTPSSTPSANKITYLPNLTKSCGAALWTTLQFMIKMMYGLPLRTAQKFRHKKLK